MKRLRLFAIFCLAASIAAAFQENGRLDLVIFGGRIQDGSGERIFAADIGIQDGKIVEIGRLQNDGKRRIDARGYWVVPGFIDMHSRCDSSLLDETQTIRDLSQGVTLALVRDCSFAEQGGFANVSAGDAKPAWTNMSEYLGRLQKKGLAFNVGAYIDTDLIRASVIGNKDKPGSPAELQRMKDLVIDAMEDGALGLSGALNAAAGASSGKQEAVELARAATDRGGIYSIPLHYQASAPIDGFRKYFNAASGMKIEVEIDSLNPASDPLRTDAWIRAIENARKQGMDVGASVSISTEKIFEKPPSAMEKTDDAFWRLLKHPWATLGNDGAEAMSRGKGLEDAEALRFFVFPGLIGLWARERYVIDAPEMIRKMTWAAAQRLNLKNRGKIAVGMAADIVIFKPETISNPQSYENIDSDSNIMQWVIVNGVVAIDEGKYTGSLSGQIVRGSGYRSRPVPVQ